MSVVVIKKLIWDEWNVTHIARHKVLPEEVEEVCRRTYIAYESYDGKFEIIGTTKQKRILLIVLDPEPVNGEHYVVTANTANRRDRKLFQEKGGETYDTKKN